MTFKQFLNSSYAKGLTQGQLDFFRLFLETDDNIFLTSEAGCGKSYIIQRLTKYCKDYGILLSKTASTGVAAVNIEAQTIHSFLGMGLADTDSSILVKKINKNKLAKKRIQDCKILLIEECSMISGETFQKVYDILRHFKNKMPRIIVVSDFLQLSPVFKTDKLYAFESKAWDLLKFQPVILTEILRQDKESSYAKVLSTIRTGNKSSLEFLESRVLPAGKNPPNGTVMVFSRNVDVDHFNNMELDKLNTEKKSYVSSDSGSEFYLNFLDKNCLAPALLRLKVGAQVMALKNSSDLSVVNGSIGKVTKLFPNSVEVEFLNGNKALIEKDIWKIEESTMIDGKVKTKTLASREQIPLKLAYSCSSFKVQGLTLDRICVDLGSCFAYGESYTILSRTKTLEGLYIRNLNPKSVKVNEKCLDFYRNLGYNKK